MAECAIRLNNPWYLTANRRSAHPHNICSNQLLNGNGQDAKIVQLEQATEYSSRPLDRIYVRASEEDFDSSSEVDEDDSDTTPAQRELRKLCGLDTDDVRGSMREAADRRQQRLVLLLDGEIKIDVLKKLLAPSVIHEEIRRCLIFIDSKFMANVFIRNLYSVKKQWEQANKKLVVTPYHGDCATYHRRVYEGLFRKWVPTGDKHSLHVIVATSALEAGVNIAGCDLIFVLDARKCSCASLTQRIGRGGRHAGRPALVVIGVSQNQQREDEEEEEEEEEETSEKDVRLLLLDPKKYLAEAQSQRKLAKSTAIPLYGDLQLIRDASHLGLDDRVLPRNNSQDEIVRKLRREIPVLSHGDAADNDVRLPARGISSNSVSLLLCDKHGRSIVARGGAPVEIAKTDAIKCFDHYHPMARTRDPHGRMVFAGFGYVLRRGTNSGASWMKRLSAVRVALMTDKHGKSVFPDLNHRSITSSEWVEDVSFEAPENVANASSAITIGVVKISREWRGYSAPEQRWSSTDVKEHSDYFRGRDDMDTFFTPAVEQTSGWTCNFSLPKERIDEQVVRDGCLTLAAALEFRAAESLNCSTQHINVRIKKSQSAQDDTAVQLQLIVYETAHTGLARELTKHLREWLSALVLSEGLFERIKFHLSREIRELMNDGRLGNAVNMAANYLNEVTRVLEPVFT